MPPETSTASTAALEGPQAALPKQTPKQRKREFRKDRRRRRRIAERIATDPTLTDTTKTVAANVLAYSDDSAKPAYPSMAAIAAGASCVQRSARRCVADLVEGGYIKRIQRPIASRRNATNLYYFCEPPGAPPAHREGQRRRPRTRKGCSDRRTRGASEPAKQLPNPPSTGPGYPQPPAPRSKTRPKPASRPGPAVPPPFRPLEPTPEADPAVARAHLHAARNHLRSVPLN